MYASHWKRAPGRATTACRNDGDHEVCVDNSADLERTIHSYDMAHPPKGWAWNGDSWVFGPWRVELDLDDGSWRVTRSGELATKEAFRTADRGRHWAEVRLARSSGPRRGPKPKASNAVSPPTASTFDTPKEALEAVVALTMWSLADSPYQKTTGPHPGTLLDTPLAQRLGLSPLDLAEQLLALADVLHETGRLTVEGGKIILSLDE